ncbi:hypothetical protein [Paenibacillus agricola]|uniref:Uncharacterized protein n=1 Tax=Paenibacillus agricola TaxID=2716264 RepID=A0ABX0IX89_9BACL|nr:hypothetical protein [Paenibacillus agricola]NHN28544.1 hypothetical protein [Paenibacillus agricola]
MKFLGYVDWQSQMSMEIAPTWLANQMNLQLFGWKGAVCTTAVFSPQHRVYGLVFTDEPPADLVEKEGLTISVICVEYFTGELDRELEELP